MFKGFQTWVKLQDVQVMFSPIGPPARACLSMSSVHFSISIFALETWQDSKTPFYSLFSHDGASLLELWYTHIRVLGGTLDCELYHHISFKVAGLFWASASREKPAGPGLKSLERRRMSTPPDRPTLTPQFCFNQTALRGLPLPWSAGELC